MIVAYQYKIQSFWSQIYPILYEMKKLFINSLSHLFSDENSDHFENALIRVPITV